MASITIRNIDERVKRALRIKAAGRGHSMEEELRVVIHDATLERDNAPQNLATFISSRFDPLGGIELGTYDNAEDLLRFGHLEDAAEA
jgi:antitoxin FitA